MGKISAAKKRQRLFKEARGRLKCNESDNEGVLERVNVFSGLLTDALKDKDFEKACGLMYAYNVGPDFFKETLCELSPDAKQCFNQLTSA